MDKIKSSVLIKILKDQYNIKNIILPNINLDILLSRVLSAHNIHKNKMATGIYWLGLKIKSENGVKNENHL